MKLPELFDEDGNLMPLDERMDYFKLFGLERKFNIEITDLSNTFKSLQRNLHPDKVSVRNIPEDFVKQVLFQFVSATQQNKTGSETWSAAVNQGYKVLQKPLSRALYLLELSGHPLSEESITLEPDFLMEIMELNEEVADANENEVRILEEKIKDTLADFILTVDILLTNDEYERAREEVARMKYYSNVLDKIYEKLSDFGLY